MVTLTAKPRFPCYQCDEQYLSAVIEPAVETVFLNLSDHNVSFALQKRGWGEKGQFDLISPPHFQVAIPGPFEPGLLMNAIRSALYESGCVCFYALTRNDFSQYHDSLINTAGYRTNYYFDLTLTFADVLGAMKSDARQRLKKQLKMPAVGFAKSDNINAFYKHYTLLSGKKSFAPLYQLERAHFSQLLNVKGMHYLEQSLDGQFAAGGFFAVNGSDVDYLYAVNSPDYPDASRLLLANAFKYFKQRGLSRVLLGGGISEDDSLANYKARQASGAVKCAAVKMIVNPEAFQNIAGFPAKDNDFDAYFPPYRRKN